MKKRGRCGWGKREDHLRGEGVLSRSIAIPFELVQYNANYRTLYRFKNRIVCFHLKENE